MPLVKIGVFALIAAAVFGACRAGDARQEWQGGNGDGDVFWNNPPHCADSEPAFARRHELREFIGVPWPPSVLVASEELLSLPVSAAPTDYHLGVTFKLWRDSASSDVFVTKLVDGRMHVFRYRAGGCD